MADENESLMTAWRAAEAQTEASGVPKDAPAEVAEPGTPAAAAPAAEVKDKPPAKDAVPETVAEVAETGDSAELAQLKALTKKLNFKIEDGRVTVAERVKFRQERREAQQRLESLQTELLDKVKAQHGEVEPFINAAKRFDESDWDGFAAELGKRKGHAWKGWDDLQKHLMNTMADPSYQVVQELKRKEQERDAAEQRRQTAEKETTANRQKQEAIANYQKGLAQEASGSEDPIAKALADDPAFIRAVYQIQDAHYDRTNDSTVTLEEALDLPPPGGKTPLRAQLKSMYERLHKAFGGEATLPAALPGKKVGKTGAIKREAEAAHVSKGGGGAGYMDPKEREYWAQQLKASEG
jgi:hypothetical protein